MKSILKKGKAQEAFEGEYKKKRTDRKVVFDSNVLDNGKINDYAETAEKISDLSSVLKKLLETVEGMEGGSNDDLSFQRKMSDDKAN